FQAKVPKFPFIAKNDANASMQAQGLERSGFRCLNQCPLCPQKRTSRRVIGMSALCQKQTLPSCFAAWAKRGSGSLLQATSRQRPTIAASPSNRLPGSISNKCGSKAHKINQSRQGSAELFSLLVASQ